MASPHPYVYLFSNSPMGGLVWSTVIANEEIIHIKTKLMELSFHVVGRMIRRKEVDCRYHGLPKCFFNKACSFVFSLACNFKIYINISVLNSK